MQNYMDVDSRPGEKEMSYSLRPIEFVVEKPCPPHNSGSRATNSMGRREYISTSENGKWTEYEFRSRGDETTHMWPVGVVRLA